MGKAIMVLGTTSGAGKSFLATAFCRYYANKGYRVAPFKAQNMSNNARIADGGEIGSAQYFQALAARAVPEVRMNPILLKPEADTASQVIHLGKVSRELTDMPWHDRSNAVWPSIREALHELTREYDIVVIEGAGSPAEINLSHSDIVNMRVAKEVSANAVLVADIDRGGAFAHLYGTWALLPEDERALIKGFILNRFRGDAALLAPGPAMLEAKTGIPTIGVLPMWYGHGLPEEDGVFDDRRTGSGFTIAVLVYPHISNLDEFQPLKNIPGIKLVWTRDAADLESADLIVLPGSKHVANDLSWLIEKRLDAPIRSHVNAGKPLLAVCGGLQMLGTELRDPYGVEGEGKALALLPFSTVYEREKVQRHAELGFGTLSNYWAPLSGLAVKGYEIRHGIMQTTADGVIGNGIGFHRGNILAVYLHGLFENAPVIHALFGADAPVLDDTFNRLADYLSGHIPNDILDSIVR
ncbi:MAG: cobyric acid synthase [Spirochaetota bacterium]